MTIQTLDQHIECFDHRVEIDRYIEAGQAFAEALRQQMPSKVRQRLKQRHGDGDAN